MLKANYNILYIESTLRTQIEKSQAIFRNFVAFVPTLFSIAQSKLMF